MAEEKNEPAVNPNMELWNSVSETNPYFTQHVDQKGGFTTVTAHSQIMKATEKWGPVGDEWGYSAVYETVQCGTAVALLSFVTVWYPNAANTKCTYGPVCGIEFLVTQKGYCDSDAGKKAMTDALTKALSHLGFSADIFLGLFDDNKYVEGLYNKYDPPESQAAASSEKPALEDLSLDEVEIKYHDAYKSTKAFLKLSNRELNGIFKDGGISFEDDWRKEEYIKAIEIMTFAYGQELDRREGGGS